MVLNELKMAKVEPKLPISESLYMQLRKDILTEEIGTGSKLTEQELCNVYGVSRTPIREALRQLEIEGLVEIIPNRGAFAVGLSARDLADIYMLRREHEVLAVGWAIERISDEQMERLEEIFEFMEFYTAKGDYVKMSDINMAFHRTIYDATGNRMLINILTSHQMYIQYKTRENSREESFKNEIADRQALLDELLKEHAKIVDAFRIRAKEEGEEAMRFHINQSMRRHGI